jgi:glycosyltransferase involved in cell wall biosynthesis
LFEQVKKNDLEKHVIFTGTRYDIPDLMAAMDVVVLAAASEATPESFGMVVIEALAMGTPVVATELGGIPDIAHDGINGYLIPPNDVDAMSKAVLRLLTNEEQARKMGETGQIWVRKEFDARSYSDKVVHVIMELLDKNSKPGDTRKKEENESIVAQ